MWLKYSDAPITLDRSRRFEQRERLMPFTKPLGCWITDDTKYCWKWWCESEEFGLERLTHKHEVVLDTERLLILPSACEIDYFTLNYGREADRYIGSAIDWQEVARDYDGVIITPYQWNRRVNRGTDWYYGWDCASGCIWHGRAIVEINLLEVSEAKRKRPVEQDEEA